MTIDSRGRYRFSSTKSQRSSVAHISAAVLAAAVAGCASHHHATTELPPQTCREVVPDPEPLLLWISPTATRDRHPLSDWCATVGPVLYYRRPPSDLPAVVDRLAVVTWNIHVGFGDVRELIRRLQSGHTRVVKESSTSSCFFRKPIAVTAACLRGRPCACGCRRASERGISVSAGRTSIGLSRTSACRCCTSRRCATAATPTRRRIGATRSCRRCRSTRRPSSNCHSSTSAVRRPSLWSRGVRERDRAGGLPSWTSTSTRRWR